MIYGDSGFVNRFSSLLIPSPNILPKVSTFLQNGYNPVTLYENRPLLFRDLKIRQKRNSQTIDILVGGGASIPAKNFFCADVSQADRKEIPCFPQPMFWNISSAPPLHTRKKLLWRTIFSAVPMKNFSTTPAESAAACVPGFPPECRWRYLWKNPWRP